MEAAVHMGEGTQQQRMAVQAIPTAGSTKWPLQEGSTTCALATGAPPHLTPLHPSTHSQLFHSGSTRVSSITSMHMAATAAVECGAWLDTMPFQPCGGRGLAAWRDMLANSTCRHVVARAGSSGCSSPVPTGARLCCSGTGTASWPVTRALHHRAQQMPPQHTPWPAPPTSSTASCSELSSAVCRSTNSSARW